jgi:hypothetical protein
MAVNFSVESEKILFERFSEFLEAPDLSRCGAVCKLWRRFSEDFYTWAQRYAEKGIPLVSGVGRDRKRDFEDLDRMTISGSQISQFLGKIVGKIPLIDEIFLGILDKPDPFRTQKSIGDNYLFAVLPSRLQRTQETQLTLDEKGNLVLDPLNQEKDLEVGLSKHNLKMLFSYPLNGEEHGPVFNENSLLEAFDQVLPSSDKVSVYFMRKRVVKGTGKLAWDAGKELVERVSLVEEIKLGAVSASARMFVDGMCILKSGTCFDQREPWTFACTPDVVHLDNRDVQLIVGGYAAGAGLGVYEHDGSSDESVFIAAGVSAEERPLKRARLEYL